MPLRFSHLSAAIIAAALFAVPGHTQAAPGAADAHTPRPTFTRQSLAELDAFAASYVHTDQVANISYGLWQRGTLLKSGYHGSRDAAGEVPVSDDTIYQIYSMTKPVTAVGLLILHERGYFDLDDPITTVLPEFEGIEVVADYDEEDRLFTYAPPNAPTFRQLLSHTAGFAYQSANRSPIDRRYIEMHVAQAPTHDEMINRIASVPLMRTPGSEWHYSIASDIQGAVIERLTGQTLQEFLKIEIFDRLAMFDTGFYVADEAAHRLSTVTRLTASGLQHDRVVDMSAAAQSRTFFEGGHGLVSTLSDYHKFLELLRRGGRTGAIQILTPDSIKLLSTNAIRYKGEPAPQRGYGEPSGLGYGFGVGTIEVPERTGYNAPAGTYFWYGVLGTWFWVDPQNDIVFVGMIQSQTPISPDIIKASMTKVYGARAGVSGSTASP